MVHLASVQSDKQIQEGSVGEFSDIEFPALDENTITSSVYGSKWAGRELPKHEMPEDEMPKEVAYRMIKVCYGRSRTRVILTWSLGRFNSRRYTHTQSCFVCDNIYGGRSREVDGRSFC